MRTVQVAQAEGPVLDWLVCKALGIRYIGNYAKSWRHCGPIIEREGINLSVDYQDSALSNNMVQIGWKGNLWNNSVPGTAGFLQWAYGPTPLVAAMRCYCCSKLGETVEVPEELT